MSSKTRLFVEVRPRVPAELDRLESLASNLMYSWDREIRALFFRLDGALWEQCGHNPKLFLRRVDQKKLEAAAEDPVYMQDYARVVSSFDAYLRKQIHREVAPYVDEARDLISYSCAEFGLHESLPIYSGGLGILAGDHCKAASDLGLPLVAMGILYRKGYFTQLIDGSGQQIVQYKTINVDNLAVSQVLDANGQPVKFSITIGNREVALLVWVAEVGHIRIYLLDSNLEENDDEDRKITHQLYGGDNSNRLRQEMILGIASVRAYRLLGLAPTIWHINEGHAAFQIVERCRELVVGGLDFESALEAVAACTVFTTHTPVPAGHDIFDLQLISEHFHQMAEEMGISMERFLELGRTPSDAGFNMTALALRGSRFHNGVSRIHGEVAASMERYIWPELPPEENPITHVTNGVHVPTFLSQQWINYFDANYGGGWRNQLHNENYWEVIERIRNHNFWSVRESMKAEMLEAVKERYTSQLRRNGVSESAIRRRTRFIAPQNTDVLTIGFARRFATYKRATLLFANVEKLLEIIATEARPVVFIFAGKAHPADRPGQELIRQIHNLSLDRRFEGRVLLLENFDIALARKLVTGVDVWLNNPIHPLEASGTSGQKAAINGVLNLSVLDGWWAEGFDGTNGWGITAHGPEFDAQFRDQEENNELLELLEKEVVPLYYDRNGQGYSERWVEMCKRSMHTLIPRFNSERMVTDYMRDLYRPAGERGRVLAPDAYAPAQALAAWKREIRTCWSHTSIALVETPRTCLYRDQAFNLQMQVHLGAIAPESVRVECLLGYQENDRGGSYEQVLPLALADSLGDGTYRFVLSDPINLSGQHCYVVRMYPHHELLSHPLEMGCMKWL